MEHPPLTYRERPADGEAAGLLVLHHGRGSDENDLLGLADLLDPQRRLHVVTPRAPLTLPGWPGYHWYVVPQVGFPDRETFDAAYAALARFHDELWERTNIPPDKTVLGGFSMGSVMSYALGLGPDRPSVAGLLVFSGFIPVVEGWTPDFDAHARTRLMVCHGVADPIMQVSFARSARETLEQAGMQVAYHESQEGHTIDQAHLALAQGWLADTLGGSGRD